jgi:L-fuculose-phosphate aldolase
MKVRFESQADALCSAAADLVKRGFVLGSGGNVSLRQDDVFYISPTGVRLDELSPASLVPVDLNSGRSISTGKGRPSSETPMHRAAYLARPEASCVVHTHSTYAIAYGYRHQYLPATTPDFLVYVAREVPVCPYRTPSTPELGAIVGEGLQSSPAVLMRKHGILVTGEDVAKAFLRTLLIHEAARLALLAGDAFEPLLPDEIAALEAIVYGQ